MAVPVCRLLGVSKQTKYKHVDKMILKIAEEAFMVEFVKRILKKYPGIGGNKLSLIYCSKFKEKQSIKYNRS